VTGARWVVAPLFVVAAACGDEVMTLHPIVDLPPPESRAYPLGSIDELTLSVAEVGHDTAIQSAQSTVEDPPTLSGVPFGDDLVLHLNGAKGGGDLAYGRSCAFSVPDDNLADVHIYFSRFVFWGETAPPVVPTRTGGYAYVLDGGARAVFVGGGPDVTDVEVFDALETGAFTPFRRSAPDTGLGVPARTGAVLMPFGDGRALLAGGVDASTEYLDRVLLVDPTGASLQVVELVEGPDVSVPQVTGHAAATLVDGSVVIAGGIGRSGVTADAWHFASDGGELVALKQPLPLNIARADHTMTRLSSEVGADVLVIGGRDDAGQPVEQAELYRPLSDSFEPIDGAMMTVPRWGHRAVRMAGGFVLVVGGMAPDPISMLDAPVARLELYDPVQGRFTDAGDLPPGAGLTEMSVSLLPDGRVLLAGGLDENGVPVSTVFFAELDAIDGRVIVGPTDEMKHARADHSAVGLCDGTVLVVGGTDDAVAKAERYNPREAGRR